MLKHYHQQDSCEEDYWKGTTEFKLNHHNRIFSAISKNVTDNLPVAQNKTAAIMYSKYIQQIQLDWTSNTSRQKNQFTE